MIVMAMMYIRIINVINEKYRNALMLLMRRRGMMRINRAVMLPARIMKVFGAYGSITVWPLTIMVGRSTMSYSWMICWKKFQAIQNKINHKEERAVKMLLGIENQFEL